MRAKLIYSENELDINKFSKFFDKECKSLKMNWSIKKLVTNLIQLFLFQNTDTVYKISFIELIQVFYQ